MRLIKIFILLLPSYVLSQDVSFGFPKDFIKLNDIIILNDISWQHSYSQFSPEGEEQIEAIDSLLKSNPQFEFSIELYYFTGNKRLSKRITIVHSNILKKLLKSSNYIIKPCGEGKILVRIEDIEDNYYKKINSIIEIRVIGNTPNVLKQHE